VALNYVTLLPNYVDGAGEPVRQGKVIFTPVSVLLAAAENLVVTQSPVVLDLTTGVTYVSLLATDNADLDPGTWAWEVQPLFPGAPPAQQVFVNFADGATQYLSDLQPATGAGSLAQGATVAGTLVLNGTPPLQLPAGAADGDVLASDSSGNASWSTLAGIGAAAAADLAAEVSRAETAESAEGARATAAEALAAQKSANLSDLANAATARTNLGLTGAATASLPLSVPNGGTGSGTQNFVDLTTSQTIGGAKTFTGEVQAQAPVNALDVATKSYVDAVATGLQVKGTVRVATTGALAAYGATSSTLTETGNGALTIDGVSVSNGDRVLVKDETSGNAPNNGIFTVTDHGSVSTPWVLDRAADMDAGNEVQSAFTFAQAGTANALTGWVCTNSGFVTLGTDPITFTQFSGAGTVTAGAGLSQSGSTLSIENSGVLTTTHGGTGAGTTAAALANLGGAAVAGDLGGTSASPTVAKIQGTAIGAPTGSTTAFLRADGTWASVSVPYAPMQI
jgi:hypothetical protein